jgi:hypothetical protein
MATSAFNMNGMNCAEEMTTLEKKLGPMPGVQNLRLDEIGILVLVEGLSCTCLKRTPEGQDKTF